MRFFLGLRPALFALAAMALASAAAGCHLLRTLRPDSPRVVRTGDVELWLEELRVDERDDRMRLKVRVRNLSPAPLAVAIDRVLLRVEPVGSAPPQSATPQPAPPSEVRPGPPPIPAEIDAPVLPAVPVPSDGQIIAEVLRSAVVLAPLLIVAVPVSDAVDAARLRIARRRGQARCIDLSEFFGLLAHRDQGREKDGFARAIEPGTTNPAAFRRVWSSWARIDSNSEGWMWRAWPHGSEGGEPTGTWGGRHTPNQLVRLPVRSQLSARARTCGARAAQNGPRRSRAGLPLIPREFQVA